MKYAPVRHRRLFGVVVEQHRPTSCLLRAIIARSWKCHVHQCTGMSLLVFAWSTERGVNGERDDRFVGLMIL